MLVLVGVSNWSRNLPCVRIMFEALYFHAHVLLQQHLGPYIPCIIYMECYAFAQKTMIIMYIRMHLSLSTVVTTISFHFISQPLTLAPVLMMPYIMILSSGCFPVLCSGASSDSALTFDSTFNDDASNDSAFDNGTLNDGTFNGNIHFQRWCFQRQWF